MIRRLAILALVGAGASGADAQVGTRIWEDPPGDAAHRPTDNGLSRPFFTQALPDLVEVRFRAWDAPNALSDPWTGSAVAPSTAHLFRIDIVFNGLVNPPGGLGFGGSAFDPDKFGVRPLFGFLEIDVDGDINTGGELNAVAHSRYLANIGRFGGLPDGPTGMRAARTGDDIELDFNTGPQIERSGADFALALCGCYEVVLVSETGDMNGTMEAGETFVVEGRFFERYQALRVNSGVFGGSDFGHYDPVAPMRYSHDVPTNRTTVSFVYALNMTGAAMLQGGSVEPWDFSLENHHSLEEAIEDIIDTANGGGGPILDSRVLAMTQNWNGDTAQDYLDPTQWEITALFGTTYTTLGSALFVWADTGFNAKFGDFDSDDTVGAVDLDAMTSTLATLDGTPKDADGVVNEVVVLPNFARNFNVFDMDYDGRIDGDDVNLHQSIAPPGDLNGDGVVDGADLGLLLGAWGSTTNAAADLSDDGVVDGADLGLLLGSWTI